jgi:RNA polymerase sigma factor (TIGR02999 family)
LSATFVLKTVREERSTLIERDRAGVNRIPDAVGGGEEQAGRDLLPIVYDELRRLAAQRLAHENPGQTLQATALVHEAYLRIVGPDGKRPWDSPGHFFAAAAEAMRRILVENARRKSRQKRGGDLERRELDPDAIAAPLAGDDLIALDEALEKLSRLDPPIAELVKLRYFADLTIPQAAEVLGISPRMADFHWKYAKAWLRDELGR